MHIAVDCGKYETKTCFYSEENGQGKFKFRTKLSPGIYEDDMIKRGTVVIQVDDGDICLYGYGAQVEPAMQTSKKTDTHKVCTLASIAMALGEGTHTDVSVAIGVPLDISANAAERMSYKEFILGKEGEKHTVRWKRDSESPIVTTTFTIGRRFVYPEGCGALWLFPEKCEGSTAIIDIGNLNTNNIYAEALAPDDAMCFTGELGGKILISGLAQALEADLGSRVAESMVANALSKPRGHRFLVSAHGDKTVESRSAEIIADYTRQHVRMLRQQCDIHHWPLDFANVVCVGGTTRLLLEELEAEFGSTVYIPEEQEHANAKGFLRRMCATLGVDTEENSERCAEK